MFLKGYAPLSFLAINRTHFNQKIETRIKTDKTDFLLLFRIFLTILLIYSKRNPLKHFLLYHYYTCTILNDKNASAVTSQIRFNPFNQR